MTEAGDIYKDEQLAADQEGGDNMITHHELKPMEEDFEDDLGYVEDQPDEPLEPEEEEEEEAEKEEEKEEAEPEGVIERTPEQYAEDERVEPAPAEEPPPEPEPEPQLYNVRVDGQDMTVSQDELLAGYQKAVASDRRFQAAAEMERNAKSAIANLLDPSEAVGNLVDLYAQQNGGDYKAAQEQVDEIIGTRVSAIMEREDLSEEEKQIADLQEENARIRERYEQEQRIAAQQQEAVARQQANASAVTFLDKSVEKFDIQIGSEEDNQASVALAEYIEQGHAVTQELADQVVGDIVARRTALLQNAVAGMSASDLMAVNPELGKQMRDADIERLKEARTTEPAETTPKSTKARRRKGTKKGQVESANDFFNNTDW